MTFFDDQDVSALTSSLEHARTECAQEQEGRAGDASNAAATAAELMLGSEAFGEEVEILAQKEASTIQLNMLDGWAVWNTLSFSRQNWQSPFTSIIFCNYLPTIWEQFLTPPKVIFSHYS